MQVDVAGDADGGGVAGDSGEGGDVVGDVVGGVGGVVAGVVVAVGVSVGVLGRGAALPVAVMTLPWWWCRRWCRWG